MPLTFHHGDLDSADVKALIALHFEQMRSISPSEACHVLPSDALRHAAVTFWSARDEGLLKGIGALRELASDEGELKSMRTAPEALRGGIGRAMLRHIMDEARSRGYRRLSVETGNDQAFVAALHLYGSEGFVPCGPFGGYVETPFTRFFSRQL